MWFCKGRILSTYQLNQIRIHQYNCINSSYLDPLLQPLWTWLVNKLPLWLAPNLITIFGLIVNVTTTLVLMWHSPDAREEAPRWVYALSAFGLFLYQTLDAIDGKQARRTNSSSPLGELFDHGCDSVSTVFLGISACMAVKLGYHPGWLFFHCFAGTVLFYCSHWETYLSGTMRFGRFDVTEAQFCIIAIQLISATFGPDIWLTPARTPFGTYSVNLVLCVVILFTYTAIIIKFARRILHANISKDIPADGLFEGRNIAAPALPLLLIVLLPYVILCKSPTNVYESNPSLFIIAFGMVAAKITNKLVVMHMTKDHMTVSDSAFCGPAFIIANQFCNSFLPDHLLLWVCLVWASADLLFYSKQVCREICEHLNIRLFHIADAQRYRDALFPSRLQNTGRRIADKFHQFTH